MAALEHNDLADVLKDIGDPGVEQNLDFAVFDGGAGCSIPWEIWTVDEVRCWNWWKRAFERAALKSLRVNKVEFDKNGRAGFQFYAADAVEGVPASWWVDKANEKIRRLLTSQAAEEAARRG